MHKIKAYTLMEVTVAMLLSAICISICYTAYGLIHSYYRTFQEKNEMLDNALTLKHVLENDCLKSRYIIRMEDGFALEQDSLPLEYVVQPDLIIRRMKDLHADSFKVKWQDIRYSYEIREVQPADTVDQIDMVIRLGTEKQLPISIHKLYSAENLFH